MSTVDPMTMHSSPEDALRNVIFQIHHADARQHHARHAAALYHARMALWELEELAAARQGRTLAASQHYPAVYVRTACNVGLELIEEAKACEACRHVGCRGACRSA